MTVIVANFCDVTRMGRRAAITLDYHTSTAAMIVVPTELF